MDDDVSTRSFFNRYVEAIIRLLIEVIKTTHRHRKCDASLLKIVVKLCDICHKSFMGLLMRRGIGVPNLRKPFLLQGDVSDRVVHKPGNDYTDHIFALTHGLIQIVDHAHTLFMLVVDALYTDPETVIPMNLSHGFPTLIRESLLHEHRLATSIIQSIGKFIAWMKQEKAPTDPRGSIRAFS